MILSSLFVLVAIVAQSEAKLFGAGGGKLCSQVEKLLRNAEKCFELPDKAKCIPKELVPKQAVCNAYTPSASATLDAAFAFSGAVQAIDTSFDYYKSGVLVLEPVKDPRFMDWKTGVSILSGNILSLCRATVASKPTTTKVSVYVSSY